jgi:hypothetical protein
MTHQFLLHFHRCSGFIQSRAVRVAERVPTDSTVPAGSYLALIVDRQPIVIASRHEATHDADRC